ncbi:CLUMA_CG016083, isoform A [Clunio marinus]|uniref:CLUMA_CG016083, isoform A n=1 Tax=Clunio marinus TaxID=568069 RepID=A0A1J1IW08_9DIPT|nr:CLUMA_CG016083, isoform A [Clunio marinus]
MRARICIKVGIELKSFWLISLNVTTTSFLSLELSSALNSSQITNSVMKIEVQETDDFMNGEELKEYVRQDQKG